MLPSGSSQVSAATDIPCLCNRANIQTFSEPDPAYAGLYSSRPGSR